MRAYVTTGVRRVGLSSWIGMTTEALPLLEHPAGMTAVDVPDKRWVDAVSEQFLQPGWQRAHDFRSDGEHVVLLRPEPAGGVLEQHAEAGGLGAVGTPPGPEGGPKEKDRPGRHRDRDRLVWVHRTSVGPPVAAGDDARRTVRLGEVVERPHGVEHDLRVRPGQWIDAVVGVQHLRLLAGPDLDASGCRELV